MCAVHGKLCGPCKKRLIDDKLKECASLFTNFGMDSTDEERKEAYDKEK